MARALGTANLIPGVVRGPDGATVLVDTSLGCLRVTGQRLRAPSPGAATTVVARPEHVRLERGGSGTVLGAAFARDALELVISDGDASVRVRVPASAGIEPGSAVTVGFDEPTLVLVPVEPGAR